MTERADEKEIMAATGWKHQAKAHSISKGTQENFIGNGPHKTLQAEASITRIECSIGWKVQLHINISIFDL